MSPGTPAPGPRIVVEATFEPVPNAAASARRWVRSRCWELPWMSNPVCDDVTLALNELVANAIVHARSPAVVTFEGDRRRLRVEVADTSPVLPTTTQLRRGGPVQGLHLVAAATSLWGVAPTGSGKVVFFEIHDTGGR